ncbi:MAG TPA: Calx-beta domain-containing protein [Kofleriaceae bacterium]|nr:Calx-beta domain-containing protein [Kofleriaceae bacterium]
MSEEVLPQVYFAADRSITDESIGNAEILLQLSAPSREPVTVGFSITGGTATLGADLRVTDGTVTFPPNTDHAMLRVMIVDDGIEELEEDAEITLAAPENAVLGSVIKHDLRISANKLPRVNFSTATSSAGEETGAQSFVIELDKPSPTDVVVKYTTNGTAGPKDHGVVDGMLTIPAGRASATLAAPIVNDPTDEYDETLDVTLIAQAGAVVAPGLGEHVHTIVDDDPPPNIGFGTATSSVSEGTATTMIEVKLSLASEKEITIDYAAAAGGTASSDDFTLAPGTLTFPPGTTSLKIPVTITNDLLDEADETVAIALSNPTNATLSGGAGQHVLTITDDDNPPTLAFQQAASSVSEATATQAITVALSAPSGRAVQFSLSRSGTSSTADLTLPAGPFTIPAGTTSFTITATITNDTLDEDNETAVLTLTNLVNANAGATTTHTVTIVDDDDPPTVRFDPAVPDRSAAEGNSGTQTYTYPVILSAASGKTITVGVSRSGSAQLNSDFTLGTGDIPVVFQPGETSKTIRVTVKGDNSNEPDEDIVLTLQTPTNATNAADNQTRTHVITNDD